MLDVFVDPDFVLDVLETAGPRVPAATAPQPWCYLCARSIDLRGEWRLVANRHGERVTICARCVEHGDAEVPMTYEEDDDAG